MQSSGKREDSRCDELVDLVPYVDKDVTAISNMPSLDYKEGTNMEEASEPSAPHQVSSNAITDSTKTEIHSNLLLGENRIGW